MVNWPPGMATVWFFFPVMLTGVPLTARLSIMVMPLFGPWADDTMVRTEVAVITTPPTVTFKLVTDADESTSLDQLMVAEEGVSAVSIDGTLAVSCEASRASLAPPRDPVSDTVVVVAVPSDPRLVACTARALPLTALFAGTATGQTRRATSITASAADAEQQWYRRFILTSLRFVH